MSTLYRWIANKNKQSIFIEPCESLSQVVLIGVTYLKDTNSLFVFSNVYLFDSDTLVSVCPPRNKNKNNLFIYLFIILTYSTNTHTIYAKLTESISLYHREI